MLSASGLSMANPMDAAMVFNSSLSGSLKGIGITPHYHGQSLE